MLLPYATIRRSSREMRLASIHTLSIPTAVVVYSLFTSCIQIGRLPTEIYTSRAGGLFHTPIETVSQPSV